MVMAGRDGNAETVSRQWVTAGIFDVLGVKPIAGRTFLPEDEEKRRHVIVMSESLWESRFNRDPAIVGQRHQDGRHSVDGRRSRAEDLRDPRPHQRLGDAAVRQHAAACPGQYMLQVVGRMKPEVAHQRRAGRSVGGCRRPRP